MTTGGEDVFGGRIFRGGRCVYSMLTSAEEITRTEPNEDLSDSNK